MSKRPTTRLPLTSRVRLPVGRLRDLPIWSKLGLIMIVPTIATIVVGTNGLINNIADANDADRARLLAGLSQDAGSLVHALQNERANATLLLGVSEPATVTEARAAFERQAQVTDAAAKDYRVHRSGLADLSPAFRTRLTAIDTELSELLVTRKQITGGGEVRASTVKNSYRTMIEDLLSIRDTTAELSGNSHLSSDLRAAAAIADYKEYVSQERVVVLRVLTSDAYTPALRQEFISTLTGQQQALAAFQLAAEPWQHDYFGATVTGADPREVARFEGTISALEGTALPAGVFSPRDWDNAMAGTSNLLRKVEAELDEHNIEDATAERNLLQRQVFVGTGALLGILLLAILFAWLVARSMARSLRELRHGALTVAQYGLPQAVARLRDPALASQMSPHQLALQIAEPLPVRSRDEFGQVAEAFNAVHLEAVRTAAEQAALRSSVATMFVNLARRSQILVDRLIGHLDRLERGEEDPDRLAELFQLDHLATRMRRNDENLLVLAGADSTRIQREPAPLMDVLRAAQSEVEHYTRVEFSLIDRDIEIAAHAVNDMVHLVAELLDNATAFSPPDSAVMVEARRVGDQTVLLVEDHGIGVSAEQLAELNDRLASPPAVDVTVSRMMGLVVVARLAARHGVKVELRPARDRGTVAEVVLPAGVRVARALTGRAGAGMPIAGAPALSLPAADVREAVAGRPTHGPRSPLVAPLALESGPMAGRAGFGTPATGAFGGSTGAFGGPASARSNGDHLNGATGPQRGLPAWSDLTGVNGHQSRPGLGPDDLNQPLPQRRSGDHWTLDDAIAAGSEPNGGIPRQRPEPFTSDQDANDVDPSTGAPSTSAPAAGQGPSAGLGSPDGLGSPAGFGSPAATGAPRTAGTTPTGQLAGGSSAAQSTVGGPPAALAWPPVGPGPAEPASPGPAGGHPRPAEPASYPPAADRTAEIPRVRLDWEPAAETGYETAESRQRFVDETMELPIFRELESAWFRAQPSPGAQPAPGAQPLSGAQAGPSGAAGGGAGAGPTRFNGSGRGRGAGSLPMQPDYPPVPGQAAAGAAGGGLVEVTYTQVPRPAGPGPSSNGPVPDPAGHRPAGAAWRSAADEGWQAAAALSDEQEFGVTDTGLPKRVPMSQLVPGGVDQNAAAAHRRTPESVRGLLSAYHRGVQRGRTQPGGRTADSKTPEPTTAGPQNSPVGKEQEA